MNSKINSTELFDEDSAAAYIGGIRARTIRAWRANRGLPFIRITAKTTVQLVRLTTSGKNALDFALAYYLGRAVMSNPPGHFHIVSGDTGFDPLIEHLRSRHIRADRHDDCVPLTTPAPASAPVTARFAPHN
jgi:hypothetical protein